MRITLALISLTDVWLLDMDMNTEHYDEDTTNDTASRNVECDAVADHAENEDIEESKKNDVTQLSESVFIYQDRQISAHGNVFEGEIRSGVYGARVCAIKFARKTEQNVRESIILTKLGSHTHVISIIQSGIYKDTFDERVFIALDKCHKQNLQQHITHQNESGLEFNLEEALDYSKQIISGMKYVHEKLIIHKDLKPSNILLSHDKSTIKLADFGLSQQIKSTLSKVYSKHHFGTNGFRPIESFGSNWASLKSDVFSLGVVVYFVLSNGKSPLGDDISLWIYNTQNGVIDLSEFLVPNANTFQHLITLMLNSERCCRPSIWQVADHPCWTGKETECNFGLNIKIPIPSRNFPEYGYCEEISDSDVQIPESREDETSDSDADEENNLQLLRALNKMGFDVSADRKTSIIIFDRNSKHLQRFSPKNKSVTRMHEFNQDLKTSYVFSSVSLGEYIYVLTKQSMHRLKYREPDSKWEQMADLLYHHGLLPPPVVVSSGAIYAVGTGAGKRTKSVSKYDPSLDRWETIRDKHLATSYATTVASKGYVYCIGGDIATAIVTDRVERLNIATQIWDEVAPTQQARRSACSIEHKGMIIVVGGRKHDFRDLTSVEKYDPDVNQWTIMKPMLEGHSCFQCHVIEGNIYAFGGEDVYVSERRTAEKYDIEKDEWELFHDFGAGMGIGGSVAVKIN